jgi:hypothetical protein
LTLHYTLGIGTALPLLEIQRAKSHQIGAEGLPGYISTFEKKQKSGLVMRQNRHGEA